MPKAKPEPRRTCNSPSPSQASSTETKPYPTTSPKKGMSTGDSPTKTRIKRWTREDKLWILMRVIEQAKVSRGSFEGIGEVMEGRTSVQAFDQFRQMILPSLKKFGAIEPTGKAA